MSKKLKNLVRNCPICNELIYYSRGDTMKRANDNNKKCNRCTQLGRNQSESSKLKRSLSLKGRIPWNRGLTKENNEIMKDISDKLKGKNITETHKKSIKLFQTHYWTDDVRKRHSDVVKKSEKFIQALKSETRIVKIKESNKSSILVQESIKLASKISAESRRGKTYNDIFGDITADRLKDMRRLQAIAQNNDTESKFGKGASLRFDTKPELAVQMILDDMGIEYATQFPIWSSYPLTRRVVKFYDIKIKNSNIIIEVHGDYWHANPLVYSNRNSLTEIQLQTIYNDEVKLKIALDAGYVVHKIWEHHTKNKDILYEKISKILQTNKRMARLSDKNL